MGIAGRRSSAMIGAMVVQPEIEYQLLGQVLDGLDDLYDRRERAEWWLYRLLVASGVALTGTIWESRMVDAAARLRPLLGEGDNDSKHRRALESTDELRLEVSTRWAELDASRAG